jgi:hypothetical protein
MKQLKLSGIVIFFASIIYFFISYGIFLYKKPLIDHDLNFNQENRSIQQIFEEKKNIAQQESYEHEDPVIIQSIRKNSDTSYTFSINPEEVSFVSMVIPENYSIDLETQEHLDRLTGDNLEFVVKLIMQSNNTIVGADACPECSVSALIKQVKQHKKLKKEDIVILQKMIANLYAFVEMTKNMTGKLLMPVDQYAALKALNVSQDVKDNLKLEERQAATLAILHKLKSMQYPDKQF